MTVYRIGELAEDVGVSVRTLRYYDQQGLLVPSRSLANGYRAYTEADKRRLQSILRYRAVGLGVNRIRSLLNESTSTEAEVLAQQLSDIRQHIQQLQQMEQTLMSQLNEDGTMAKQDLKYAKSTFDPDRYEAEAESRWGETDAFKVSQQRTKSYSKEQWQEPKEGMAELERQMAELMVKGVNPEADSARQLAESMRLHIDRWFYPCSLQMHKLLADMYVQDQRFKAHYDDQAPGLANFVRDAIMANSDEN